MKDYQQTVNAVAKQFKRSDVQLAVMFSAETKPHFALKLGEGQWIRTRNLANLIEVLLQSEDEQCDLGQKAAVGIEQGKETLTILGAIDLWKHSKPVEPPPF